jgi:hypothetical protein
MKYAGAGDGKSNRKTKQSPKNKPPQLSKRGQNRSDDYLKTNAPCSLKNASEKTKQLSQGDLNTTTKIPEIPASKQLLSHSGQMSLFCNI